MASGLKSELQNEDKLYLKDRTFYLTLKNDTFTITQVIDEGTTEEIESYHVLQNEQGLDVEDRVEAGLKLVKKYLV